MPNIVGGRFQSIDKKAREQLGVQDLTSGTFQPGLRIKAIQGANGVFEMTWPPDGRATLQYGAGQGGSAHVIWRRIGAHAVLKEPQAVDAGQDPRERHGYPGEGAANAVDRASIRDWWSMVDAVMLDPAWDGRVVMVARADIPEPREDLVDGTYELSLPAGSSCVGVKITDMPGEEVLVSLPLKA